VTAAVADDVPRVLTDRTYRVTLGVVEPGDADAPA
jgi:hypothetical protein